MAILPEYNHLGELHSKALEQKDSLLMDICPYTMIDEHFRYYGSGIAGAIEGAKAILNAKVNPIALNGPDLIILIPTKSPIRKDCIWLNLHHIKEYKAHSEKETLILFSNGDTIVIDISTRQLAKRINKGYILRSMLKERQNKKLFFVLDPETRYHYHRNKGTLNFEMRIERKKGDN